MLRRNASRVKYVFVATELNSAPKKRVCVVSTGTSGAVAAPVLLDQSAPATAHAFHHSSATVRSGSTDVAAGLRRYGLGSINLHGRETRPHNGGRTLTPRRPWRGPHFDCMALNGKVGRPVDSEGDVPRSQPTPSANLVQGPHFPGQVLLHCCASRGFQEPGRWCVEDVRPSWRTRPADSGK
jgi:hypothetical protein